MAQSKKRHPCKKTLCNIVRDCRYLRGYIFDTQYTIAEMEQAADKGIYKYALKELDYIRKYLNGISDRIYQHALKEDK